MMSQDRGLPRATFKPGTINFGTVVHYAREYGWSGSVCSFEDRTTVQPFRRVSNTAAYAKRLYLAALGEDSIVAAHPYPKSKGIDWAAGAGRGTASGSRIGKMADCIVIPIRNIKTDKVQGVECINANGKKQAFGQKSEGALILGNIHSRK